VQRFDARVVVSPVAFDETEIPIEIGAKEIRNQPFRSDEELRDALREAPVIMVEGAVTAS
jgi:hypothetical protein